MTDIDITAADCGDMSFVGVGSCFDNGIDSGFVVAAEFFHIFAEATVLFEIVSLHIIEFTEFPFEIFVFGDLEFGLSFSFVLEIEEAPEFGHMHINTADGRPDPVIFGVTDAGFRLMTFAYLPSLTSVRHSTREKSILQ